MFSCCTSLKEVKFGKKSNFNQTSTANMFSCCHSLKHLDLSEFKLNNIYTYEMFSEVSMDYINMYNCIHGTLNANLLLKSNIKYVYIRHLRHAIKIKYIYDPIYGMYKLI